MYEEAEVLGKVYCGQIKKRNGSNSLQFNDWKWLHDSVKT